MGQGGQHRRPKAVRLLAAAGAVLVAGGVVAGIGAASAVVEPGQVSAGQSFGPSEKDFVDIRQNGQDANQNGGGKDGNTGAILSPGVTLQFRGNQAAQVTAMPRFLRAITGDAKAVSNGGGQANAKWTCTGFEDRVTTKYPL